jgi:hypothetical protein
MIGTELRASSAIDVFQSKWFEDQITEETKMLVKTGVGTIHSTRRQNSLQQSLVQMRIEMLTFTRLLGAVYIGGMEGILDEYEYVGKHQNGVPRIPIAGPGGAAASLSKEDWAALDLPPSHMHSRSYPFVSSLIVEALAVHGQMKGVGHEPI